MARISKIINDCFDWSVDSWVDFGTGDGKVVSELKWNDAREKIAVEIFPHKLQGWRHAPVLGKLLNVKRDLFTAFDVIEHLSDHDGMLLLKRIDPWFRHKIFFTPRGFLKQDEITHPELVNKNPWQKHLSGWVEADFHQFGYHTKVLKDFHNPQGVSGLFDAILAWK